MTSTAPARKPYRKAPPQHRETRHTLPAAAAAPPPAPQPDINQVNQHTLNTHAPPPQHLTHLAATSKRPRSTSQPLPPSDSELEVSSLSSGELCIPPPLRFSSHSRCSARNRTTAAEPQQRAYDAFATSHKRSPAQDPRRRLHSWTHRTQTVNRPIAGNRALIGSWMLADPRTKAANPTLADGSWKQAGSQTQRTHFPKGILKQPAVLDVTHTYDVIRKSKSVEVLDDSQGRGGAARHQPTRSLDRTEQRVPSSRCTSAHSSACSTDWNWRMQVLEEKVRFSNFLDEITCRVLSPAHLTLLGRSPHQEQGFPAPYCRRHSPAHRKQQLQGADRARRWDNWVAALQRPGSLCQPQQEEDPRQETPKEQGDITEGAGLEEEDLEGSKGVKLEVREMEEPQRHKPRPPVSNPSLLSHIKVGLRRVTASTFTLLHPSCCPHLLQV